MRAPSLDFEDLFPNSTTLTTPYEYYFFSFATVALCISIFIFFMILPFYIHVFKLNRERDKNTPIFAVVEHYYGMVWKLGIAYICFFVSLFYFKHLVKVDGNRRSLFPIIALCIVFAGVVINFYIDEVNQLMLSLLAIQRFFLYFFPNMEKFWSLSAKTMKSIIWVTYGLVLFAWLMLFCMDIPGVYLFIYYMSVNTICIVSALLYMPIFWNIRKFTHLASAQMNHPQRYVLWQLVALAIAKCILIPPICFLSDIGFLYIIGVCKLMNSFLTPIVMQVTYLGCNRRNVQELWNTFRPRKFLQVVCCPCKPSIKVTPGGGQVNLEMTTMQQ